MSASSIFVVCVISACIIAVYCFIGYMIAATVYEQSDYSRRSRVFFVLTLFLWPIYLLIVVTKAASNIFRLKDEFFEHMEY